MCSLVCRRLTLRVIFFGVELRRLRARRLLR
jgi:hypothetical protein